MGSFKTKPLLTLLALTLCFAIPMLLAMWLYGNPLILAKKTTNRGLLISPPLSMTQLQVEPISNHKWKLAVFSPHDCLEKCQKGLHFLQQIQLASGKDRNRISRILLTYADTKSTQNYPDIPQNTASKQQINRLIEQQHQLAFMKENGGILIADPHDNVILAYSLDSNYMDIFNDLRHLLKASQIG